MSQTSTAPTAGSIERADARQCLIRHAVRPMALLGAGLFAKFYLASSVAALVTYLGFSEWAASLTVAAIAAGATIGSLAFPLAAAAFEVASTLIETSGTEFAVAY